ncbi:MAG: hypothetical protein V7L25_11910 [Nostoc sp.]|uniref:hypothetical protein n=1 Tax=Nostoc sp. TaxID=1180 RepID=UPI002FF2DA93
MESTLFTTLTPNEEANLSGGNPKKVDPKKIKLAFAILNLLSAKASNSVTQTATGGAGGNGGPITIGGGSNSPVVIIKSTITSNGGNGGDASNTSNNGVAAST